MIPVYQVPRFMEHLNEVTNDMAEFVKLLRTSMTGKGISPREAPLWEMKLQELENQLRMIAGNEDNPIPFNHGIRR